MSSDETLPDVTTTYDDGYFDKDEQGWCGRNVEIRQDGRRVFVHTWGDDNGLRPFDEHREGTIARVFLDRALVVLDLGSVTAVFDLNTRRLSYRTQVVREFVPPADVLAPAFHAAAMQLVLDVASALGGRVRTAPDPPPWTEPQPSATYEGATERRSEIHVEGGRVLALWRALPHDREAEAQLVVELHDDDAGIGLVQVFAWRRDRGHVLFGGPIEHEPAALAVIDRWCRLHAQVATVPG